MGSSDRGVVTAPGKCRCQSVGGASGPCLCIPGRERAPKFVARSPLASLPPADPAVWGPAAPGSAAMARPSRGAKWTAEDRTRARAQLKAAGKAWKDAYEWAVSAGVEGRVPVVVEPAGRVPVPGRARRAGAGGGRVVSGGRERTCGRCRQNPAVTTIPPLREGQPEVDVCVKCWQAEYRRLADEKRADREGHRRG